MLYAVYSMRHRTQLYLDDAQYRWLRQQAGTSGSLAGVVRKLIDDVRLRRHDQGEDPLIRFLLEDSGSAESPASPASTVETLDADLYG